VTTPPSPPPAVADVVGSGQWEPVPATGTDGSVVWRTDAHHVKLVPAGAAAPDAAEEAARLTWLAARGLAPEPAGVVADDAGTWLVVPTLAGLPAHRAELHPDTGVLVAAVARALRALHELAVDDCPFDAGWARLDAEVAATLAAGRLDPATLDPPFSRYEAGRLVELWRAGRPAGEDAPVVVHGDASLPNLLVDGDTCTGFVDVGRLGVGDRHLDLAVVHQSIQRNLGPQAVFAFYDAYGTDPDLVRLEHYRLGTLLR
jgi:aminoglycoside phosphotransferase